MPHSFGYRARTRHLFKKDFRDKGTPSLGRYLINYKVGDIVDIKADASIHKGMPFKYYHGRTGTIFNVTKSSVGVILNKRVRHRVIAKRIYVRVEHVKPSKCRIDFLNRVNKNREDLVQAKKDGKTILLKRTPGQPRPSTTVKVKNTTLETVAPIAYIPDF